MVPLSTIDAVPFLRGLESAAKAEIAARAITARYGQGQRLWSAGDPPKGLFVILAGRVRVVRSRGKRAQLVHVEGPGATLGEVPLFAGGTYPATAVAVEPTTCLVLDRQSLTYVMRAQPALAWALLERLASRLRVVLDKLGEQGADPVVARLARYVLARQADAEGGFTLGATQEAVAEELGTAREVIVRLMTDLLRAGVLERRGRARYAVRDANTLHALAAHGTLSKRPNGIRRSGA
jgi:CRP-like cAMP-binding protein